MEDAASPQQPRVAHRFNRRETDRWFPKLWHPELLHSNIDTRIAGTLVESVFQEFVNNSAHFPFVYLILEWLYPNHEGPPFALQAAVLVLGALAQSVFLGTAEFRKHPRPLPGNLIAPTLCLALITLYPGASDSFHATTSTTFFGYSLLIGMAQELRFRAPWLRVKHLSILFENTIRSSVVLVMIWKAHTLGEPGADDPARFLAEPYHLYIFLVIPLIGALAGMANINAYRYMTILRNTAVELKKYSEWLLGPDLLKKSLRNPTALNLRTADRTVVFMDIRGFTRWSDSATPEEVVRLVNEYFQVAEDVLKGSNAIKVELTGDEILAAFYMPDTAVWMALELRRAVDPVLEKEGLSVGVGINTGSIIEGLVGGRNLKKYSVMGDTVNTGKRICDVAGPGEILIAESTRQALDGRFVTGDVKAVSLKGKKHSVNVCPLLGLKDPEADASPSPSRERVHTATPVPQE